MSEVVQIPPTIEALWRANFAAGDRHDDDEAELLRCLWREAMDAKLPPRGGHRLLAWPTVGVARRQGDSLMRS
jgi:hypothetical protein